MSSFEQVLCSVPRGKVTTYGELARALGTHPRAVGRMLNKNPHPMIVPCHRVINSDGRLGGFATGSLQKERILRNEGIEIIEGRIDLNRFFHKF
jgi:methylated-DNA-[protein]-cysteine S-methyltransferase